MTPLTFEEAFAAEIEEAEQRAPDYPRETWDCSGRASKAYPNKRDEAWWHENGPLMVDAWKAWRADTNWQIATVPDLETGELIPMIELPLRFDLADGPWVGYLDTGFLLSDGTVAICDLKTGASKPSGTGQLGLYKVALQVMYGVTANWGFYFWGGNALPLEPLDLWTPDLFASMGEDVRFMIDNDVFPPHPNMLCNSCGVRDYCHVFGGANAVGNDPLAVVA